MIPPSYYGAGKDDDGRAFDAAAEILAERLKAANKAIRDAARIALPAVAFLESLGVTVNGYDLSRDEALMEMIGGISASAEADILDACVQNYAPPIDVLNGLLGDAEQAQADAIKKCAAIDVPYNGDANMIAPDWFHFDQAPYGDRDRLTRAEVDGAELSHKWLVACATVSLHALQEMRDLGVTTIADHNILDVIQVLADISGKKACTA
jgi:hypothetical protein